MKEAKQHIEALAATNRRFASELEASRRTMAAIRHDRAALRQRVDDAKIELGAIHDRLEESRRKTKLLLEQRLALRQEAVTARGQLSRAEVRLSVLAEQLDQVTRERDAAYSELEEATCALVDIREQLKASLQTVEARDNTVAMPRDSFPSAV